VSTTAFKREHAAPITLTEVKYVPGLKKKLASVTVLEDHVYDVFFSKGKIFLRQITTRPVKQTGSRVKNLYFLEVQDVWKAMRSKVNVRGLVVERESKLPLNMQP